MAEGDIKFKVSAQLELKKSKFTAELKKATRQTSALDKAMQKGAARRLIDEHNLLQFAKKQRLAQQQRVAAAARAAREIAKAEQLAARARKQAEREASRMAARREREMAKLARQARKAEIALSRLKMKGAKRGLGAASGMLGMGGGLGAMGGIGRAAGAGGVVAGGAAALGMGGALVQGLRFNKVMEDTSQSVATMFQMFDVGKAYFDKGLGDATVFDTNVNLAKEATAEILRLQAETPAGAMQISEVFGQGMAGLAKGTKDVKRMLDLTTQISMLGPSLNNDYGQLGRDTMRILSGSAEQEVQVWRLLKEQFHELAVSKKMLKGGMDHEAFTKAFNKQLTAAQRLELFEESMSKLGPKFREMFAKSMSGLLTTTGSKLQMIAGQFAKPLYKSFLSFMARANVPKEGEKGLLAGNMMGRWMGIAGYFGARLGEAAAVLLLAFEKGMWFVDKHWSKITDSIILAFKIGGLLIKAYITQALARAALAPILMAAKGGVGAAKGGLGLFGKVGKMAGKIPGIKEMGAIAQIAQHFRLLMFVAGPAAIAIAAFAAAIAVLAFGFAGVAAYFVKNWKKMMKSITESWDKIGPRIQKIYLIGNMLFDMMALVGEALTGGVTGASAFISVLALLEEALMMAAKGIIFMSEILGGLSGAKQFGYELEAGQRENQAEAYFEEYQRIARASGFGSQETRYAIKRWRKAEALSVAAREDATANKARTMRLKAAAGRMKKMTTAAASKERLRKAAEIDRKLREGFEEAGDDNNKPKPPKGGVHVTNMYNQWDLRNTDPDRLMSAFLPKLEGLADKRTQGRDVQPQGI